MDISEFLENGFKQEHSIRVTSKEELLRRQYNEKIVAWIDILGMREKIRDYQNHDAEEILTIMERFQHYISNSCEGSEIVFMQISDGFIFVSEFIHLKDICEILCQIQWKILIHDNMLLRGGLTSGKISINDEQRLIVGPAFIEAYVMESENAIFPRIIISNNIHELAKLDYIVKDSDYFYFLDFLEYVNKKEDYNVKQFTHILRTSKVIEYLKKEYNNNIRHKLRIAQKYGWLIEKLSVRGIKVL